MSGYKHCFINISWGLWGLSKKLVWPIYSVSKLENSKQFDKEGSLNINLEHLVIHCYLHVTFSLSFAVSLVSEDTVKFKS